MTMTAAVPPRLHAAPLSDEQRIRYEQDGFLIVRNFFSPAQIAAAATEADGFIRRTELIHTDNLRCRWTTDTRNQACVFETFDPVADLAPACGKLATDARLLDGVGILYDEEACLFKDKLIFKPSGEGVQSAPGLHFLAQFPQDIHDRHRSDRSLDRRQRLHRSLRRLSSQRQLVRQ